MKKLLPCLLFFPLSLWAQQDSILQLRTVEVSGASLPTQEKVRLPIAENPQVVSSTENLNFIPGVTAFEGTAGTAKFSYRGMGARTQYSTSRSLVYFGDIPITSIQGFSSFEDINPFWAGNFTLMKNVGQAYPLALGGVLRYDPSIAPSVKSGNKFSVFSSLGTGSFGLLQSNSYYAYRDAKFNLMFGYEKTYKEGFRENNELNRESIYLNAGWNFTPQHSLKLTAYGIKNNTEIPSSLSFDDFEQNPETAAESWAEIEGFKRYNRLISGLTFQKAGDQQKGEYSYSVTAFYQHLDNFEPRPFNILQESRHSGGLRGRLISDSIVIGGTRSVMNAFAEYHLADELAETFENRYDSASQSFNNRGAAINETPLFGQRLNTGVGFNTALSHDEQHRPLWSLKTRLNSYYQINRLGSDEKEAYDVPFLLAPLVGLEYRHRASKFSISPEVKFYRSYSIPSLEENLDPDGSINQDLKPELAWTGEIGVELAFPETRAIMLHLNYYYTEVENLIVPRVIAEDQVVATNAGTSRHTGLEFNLTGSPQRPKSNWFPEYQLSGYFGEFSYLDFRDVSGTYSGNQLPGFPEYQVNASAEMNYENAGEEDWGASLGALARYTSGYYVDDENSVATDDYFLLQTWAEVFYQIGNSWRASVTAGVKNLTDTRYASMTVVNNQGFGGQPRYYYPGEPLNWFGRFSLNYAF